DYLAAGPRDILVPQSGAEAARDVLLEGGLAPTGTPVAPGPGRVLLALVVGLALIGALLLLTGAGGP
ncbi:MAG: hypothetical protein H0U80_00710, partial [Solirubrobacterales bacterium]|nr:hypothetical protein [Solirubrobacterales bacterium]